MEECRVAVDGPTNENELRDMAEEDLEEGMDRMQDEGGGVVEQNFPAGAPVLRNDLTPHSTGTEVNIPNLGS